MADDDDRLQQQCHRPHAEQALEDDEADEHERHDERLLRIAAIRKREPRKRDANEAEGAREIAMDHLAPRLADLERPLRVVAVEALCGVRMAVRHDHLAVAAGPVGTTEAGVGQTDPRTDRDDQQRERGTEARETQERSTHQPIPDASSKRSKSRKSSFCSTSGG